MNVEYCLRVCLSNSVSYRNICSVMHQLRYRKVNEKQRLIVVDCFSLKISIYKNMRLFCVCMFGARTLFYISLSI